MDVVQIKVVGPLEKEFQITAKGYDRFYFKPDPPSDAAERRDYAREILRRFAKNAFRRPADEATLDRLVSLAEHTYRPRRQKIRRGHSASADRRAGFATVLVPHRRNRSGTSDGESHPLIDEYSLASRLSYFLWSSMPDDQLFRFGREKRAPQKLTRSSRADAERCSRRSIHSKLRRSMAAGARIWKAFRSTSRRCWRAKTTNCAS